MKLGCILYAIKYDTLPTWYTHSKLACAKLLENFWLTLVWGTRTKNNQYHQIGFAVPYPQHEGVT